MSTQERKDSSRANGAKARGPVTPEGRARSRAARLTHGLTSDQILLEYESQEQFNALREEYFADYRPQTRPQFDLVDQLVTARWRLSRVIALQTALMDHQMARQEPEIREMFVVCDGETRAAIAYQHLIDDGGALESLNRHETRLSAELRRTMKQLDAQQKNQKLHEEPNGAPPPRSDEDTDDAEGPPSTIDQPPSAKLDAPPKDQKFHHEPSNVQPPQSDEDGPAPEAPRIPSAIDRHPKLTADSSELTAADGHKPSAER